MRNRLSPKQELAFAHATSDDIVFLADGATSGGKTAASGAAFGLFAALHDGDHALIGVTEAAVMNNVVYPQPLGLMAAVRAAGWPCVMSGVDGRHVSIDGGRVRIFIFGASSRKAVDRIAGRTFVSAKVDELTRLHSGEALWQMLWTRFRSPAAMKVWATTNPGPKQHWVKRIVIDQSERYGAKVVSFTMDDNPSLTDQRREVLAAGLFGHHKLRLIDGLWVDATGLIFPHVETAARPPLVSHWSVGLDWAASGMFATTLHGHCAKTGRRHVAAERFYDHRELGPMSEQSQADATAIWFREAAKEPIDHGETVVYGDPTTPTAFQEMLEAHGFVWEDGFNDVLKGIQHVNSAFGAKMLTVDRRCVNVLRELDEYAWDREAADKGEDKPQKGNDHGMDSIRYAEATESPLATEYQWT